MEIRQTFWTAYNVRTILIKLVLINYKIRIFILELYLNIYFNISYKYIL
jgi:hypothetical protein